MRSSLKTIYRAALSLVAASLCFACDDDTGETSQPDAATVSVFISSTTENTIAVTLTPDRNTVTFEYGISKNDSEENFTGGNFDGTITKGEVTAATDIFDNLDPGTDYYIFARGFNSSGQPGAVTKIRATTKEETIPPKETAKVTVVLSSTTQKSITVIITPDENTRYFDCAISTTDDEKSFTDGSMTGIRHVEGNNQSVQTFDDLVPETAYYIYVRGYNSEDQPGPVASLRATTDPEEPELKPSLASVDLAFNDLSAAMVTVTYTPNEYCVRYISIVAYAEFVEEYLGTTDEQIISTMEEYAREGYVYQHVFTSDLSWRLSGYVDIETVCVVVAYDPVGKPKLIMEYFSTPPFDPSAPKAGLTVNVHDITENSVKTTFEPDGSCVGYYMFLYFAEEYDYIESLQGEEHMKIVTMEEGSIMLERGSFEWNYLPSGTELIIVGVPFNVNGASGGFGDMAKERFTTLGSPPDEGRSTSTALGLGQLKNPKRTGIIDYRKTFFR